LPCHWEWNENRRSVSLGVERNNMDDLTERLSHRVLRECGNQQVRLLQDLQVDMVKRGILGSGIEEHGKIEIAITCR